MEVLTTEDTEKTEPPSPQRGRITKDDGTMTKNFNYG